jgi:hypothetical protein
MATSMITMELLGRVTHADPRHGCNVLELASVLAGEPWSTQPHSVHPALAAVAGTVNDLLSDDRRRLLAPIAPWLPGTNTADPRVWPAIVNVCTRAAAPVGGPGQPQLPAAPDEMSSQPAEGNSPGCGRRRRPWPGPRHRRWAKAAIGSALRSLAGSADQCDTDAALCQVLVDCINECRWLAGKEAVAPEPGGTATPDVVARLRLDGAGLPAGALPGAGARVSGSGTGPGNEFAPAKKSRQAGGHGERCAKRRKSAGNAITPVTVPAETSQRSPRAAPLRSTRPRRCCALPVIERLGPTVASQHAASSGCPVNA